MVKDIALRMGVVLVLLTGMLTLTSGLAFAEQPCEWDCDDDNEDDDPYYEGPNPDIGGAISEFIGNLTDDDTPTVTSP